MVTRAAVAAAPADFTRNEMDHALKQWKETLQEVERVGGGFWEVQQFLRVPGVGPIAAHVFSAIIEEPSRFPGKFKLWKYSQLGSPIVPVTINPLAISGWIGVATQN